MTAGEAAIKAKRRPAEEVLGHIAVGGDAIVGLGNWSSSGGQADFARVAHPKFREELAASARECGYLR